MDNSASLSPTTHNYRLNAAAPTCIWDDKHSTPHKNSSTTVTTYPGIARFLDSIVRACVQPSYNTAGISMASTQAFLNRRLGVELGFKCTITLHSGNTAAICHHRRQDTCPVYLNHACSPTLKIL